MTASIVAPGGRKFVLSPQNFNSDGEYAECSVQKFSGDNYDVTDSISIFVHVRLISYGIEIDGGEEQNT